MGKAIKSVGNSFSSAMPAIGAGVGGMFGPGGAAIGGIAGSIAGQQMQGSGPAAPGLRRIETGNTTFNREGKNNNKLVIDVDPSIRAGQEDFLNAVRGFRAPVNSAFDEFQNELGGIRDEVTGLRGEFEGNQSAFRAASLAPLQERIARREGALDTELGRTKVRGTFADQSRTNFQLDAGRTLSNQEAVIEQERIQGLSQLLGMDADIIQAGLTSEQGRLNMLMSLEQSLMGVSTERFSQEMQLLTQGSGIQTTPFQQQSQANTEGIFAGEVVKTAGTVLENFITPQPTPTNDFRSSIPGPHS